jgi:hypothetical protein
VQRARHRSCNIVIAALFIIGAIVIGVVIVRRGIRRVS